MKYKELSVKEFLDEVKEGNIDLEDFISEVIEEIKRINESFNYFVYISEEQAIAQAENIKKRIKKGENGGRLLGLPISVKDCICCEGIPSRAGSKILEGYIPPFDSTAVRKIKEEGGIIIGKTSQDEFGFGSFCTNVGIGFKIPKNPFDPERSTGGSSGGAAGITASLNYPHIALAESTGGSISCPASFCGCVGLTPTYGRVSRYGLIDFANSLDKIGPIGKRVYDCALLLSVIAGEDNMDQTTIKQGEEDYTKYLKEEKDEVKIGIPKEYFGEGVDERISKLILNVVGSVEGMEYEECSLPYTKYGVPTYYLIALSEASTNLAKFCGMRYGLHLPLKGDFNEYFSNVRSEGLGDEAKRRIILGTFARMKGYRDRYYIKAMKIRTMIINDFKKAFKKYDVLITPTMPILPPKFDELSKLELIQMYMLDLCTNPPNVAGIPHISIPCGKIEGLPIGMQIMADHMEERKVLVVARKFEKELNLSG
ncbi:MAG: Asp-tRNA(Asn)/Glu-tRNA(Gln) amidotransferase subunit GatA [Hadesarchaea archaeon]|nr:Asp-tRNA(Asn)/Glu-tRNA(Gln) amidotransferase subunit GatA [Hadesarchaea archaeon]